MNREKKLDLFCVLAAVLAFMIAVFLVIGCFFFTASDIPANLPSTAYLSTDYVDKLFNDSYVHEIDIRVPDVNWDYMVRFAEDEQYVLCDLVIDGETIENVAIRPKGNSSLTAIKSMNSDRFSFKIEFDHYRADTTYHGLDKLALNNLGQDVSCLKDYLSYQMMNAAGIPSPLTSYVHVKKNGKDFGLYLAVEAVEDSFVYRNYGDHPGNLYLPECFAIANVTPQAFLDTNSDIFTADYTSLGPGERVDLIGTAIRIPFEKAFGYNMEVAALRYAGEEPDRYNVFFDASTFPLTRKDKLGLIQALKHLNDPDPSIYRNAVDYDAVIPYFIAHNFVNNYDSYTGIFVHNYYLREADGKLSLIPWDYNLGFGIFTMESAIKSIMGEDSPYVVDLAVGNAMDDKTSMINYPIDTPTFTVSVEDRPLLAAVLQDSYYLEIYHEKYQEFLDSFFISGKFEEMYQTAIRNISPYVNQGQTFYSYEQFLKASKAVYEYCILRQESIQRQLDGTLPSTMEGQKAAYENLVDASHVDLASSVSFDSLVFGIRNADVSEILDAIAGDHPHTSEGVNETIAEIMEDKGAIISMIGRILSGSRLLQKAISKALSPPLLLLISLILLAIVRKKVRRYQRRKR